MRKNNIGENIIRIRKEKGISQKELAKKIGISAQNLLQIEKGKSEPKSGTLDKIMQALDITPNELYGEQDFYSFKGQLPFARNLSAIQCARDLSDKEFSELIHIPEIKLQELKKGTLIPSANTLSNICISLGVTEDELTVNNNFVRSSKEIELLNVIEYKKSVLEEINKLECEGIIEIYKENGEKFCQTAEERIRELLLGEIKKNPTENLLNIFENMMDEKILHLSKEL